MRYPLNQDLPGKVLFGTRMYMVVRADGNDGMESLYHRLFSSKSIADRTAVSSPVYPREQVVDCALLHMLCYVSEQLLYQGL
jgi:hypothetical protein